MKLIVLCVFLLLGFSSNCFSQNLFINEIISENVNGEMDDFFQREDWIEIYNTGGITNLAGYYLSDDPDSLDRWKIPATNAGVTTILPNNHLIFWIDRDPEQGPDHADFNLNPDGETVFLVAPDGITIIDSISYPPMAADISYGRICDGCDGWQFFNNVTFDDDNVEIIPPAAFVLINEVQANNVSYIRDNFLDHDAWVEIFNPNSTQVNLAGYSLTLNGTQTWTFPTQDPFNTAIPAGEFKIFWCDGEPNEGGHHGPFELPITGATLTLRSANNTLLDTYTYPSTTANQSYGRTTDGATNSIVFNAPTPQLTNSLVIIDPPTLYINEVLSVNVNDILDNAGQTEDWFEIYNPNAFSVNIGGYYVSDNPENPRKWQIPSFYPDSVTIPAQSWILFWADEDMGQGVMHASFRLSNNLESLRFTSPDGITLIDEISWQGMDPDTSLGRFTDGSPSWVYFLETTPDESNNGALVNVKESNSNIKKIVAFPNPTSGMIRFNESISGRIYSSTGVLVETFSNQSSLELNRIDAGIYFLHEANGSIVRIVKQ